MKKTIFSADEMNWLIHNHQNWIESTEKSERGPFLVDFKDWVTPTQIFDAGRACQMYFTNLKIGNNEN
jgi:hypothetical protein